MNDRRDANNRRPRYEYTHSYIGDDLARKLDDPVIHRMPEDDVRRRRTRNAHHRKAGIKAFDVVAIIVAAAILIIAFTATISTISTTNELNNEISTIESQINDLKVLNDSKEYAIDSSVDLDYVSQVAINELGMVRSSAGQIVTYEVQNSEYIQQVAEIPTN